MGKFLFFLLSVLGVSVFFPLAHVEQAMTNGTSSKTICSHSYPVHSPHVSKAEQQKWNKKKGFPHSIKSRKKKEEKQHVLNSHQNRMILSPPPSI